MFKKTQQSITNLKIQIITLESRIDGLQCIIDHLTDKLNRAEANVAHMKPIMSKTTLDNLTIDGTILADEIFADKIIIAVDPAASATESAIAIIERAVADLKSRTHDK